jgi:hypothetical protein
VCRGRRGPIIALPANFLRSRRPHHKELVPSDDFVGADHLASWAGLCPGNNESAGERKKTTTRNGNAQLCSVLVESAWAVSRTQRRLGARFRRLRRRFGRAGGKKAAVAIAHTILVTVWHVLHDQVAYTESGADYYDRRNNPDAQKAPLLRQLKELGYDVEISPAA